MVHHHTSHIIIQPHIILQPDETVPPHIFLQIHTVSQPHTSHSRPSRLQDTEREVRWEDITCEMKKLPHTASVDKDHPSLCYNFGTSSNSLHPTFSLFLPPLSGGEGPLQLPWLMANIITPVTVLCSSLYLLRPSFLILLPENFPSNHVR